MLHQENHFIDPDYPTAAVPIDDSEDNSPFMTGVTGFNRGVERLTSGVMDLTARMAGAEKFRNTLQQLEQQREAELALLKRQNPISGSVGEILGGMAVTSPIPGGAVGSLGRRLLTGALAGAGIGGMTYAPTLTDRAKLAGLGALLSGGTSAALAGLGLAGKTLASPIRGRNAQMARQLGKLGREIELDDDVVKAAKEAADLDTFLTPGEASGSKVQLSREARILVSPKAQRALETQLDARSKTLIGKTKDLLDDLVDNNPKAMKKTAAELYESAKTQSVSPEAQQKLTQNPILQKITSEIEADTTYGLADQKVGTIEYYKTIKEAIDDKLYSQSIVEKAASGGQKLIKSSSAATRNLQAAQKQLVQILDDASPEYAQARKLTQKLHVREKYLNELNSIVREGGSDVPTSSQIYDRLAGSVERETRFLKDIRRADGNVEQAKTVINVLNKVKGSKLDTLLKSQNDLITRFNLAGGPGGVATSSLWKLITRKQQEAFLSVITNPRWADEVTKLKMATNPANALTTLIQRAMLIPGLNVARPTIQDDATIQDPDIEGDF